MKSKTITSLIIILLFALNLRAQDRQELMTTANEFINSLSDPEKSVILFSFDDTLRTRWSNLPKPMVERYGMNQGNLSDASRTKLQAILRAIFGSQGYLKSNLIMRFDDTLSEYYEWAHKEGHLNDEQIAQFRKQKYSQANYWVSIFGTPSLNGNWSFRMEGHHLSINVTVTKENVSVTPTFMGIDPPEVHTGKYAGLKVLGKEEDYGLNLFHALNPNQKAKAIFTDKVFRDVVTLPNAQQRIDEMQGISAREFNDEQKELLREICREFLCNYETEKCEYYRTKFEGAAVNGLYFGWSGGDRHDTVHYYIVNGPDFTIECDDAGWFFEGDHIHSIVRDKNNDFNEDILRSHYLNPGENHSHDGKNHTH